VFADGTHPSAVTAVSDEPIFAYTNPWDAGIVTEPVEVIVCLRV
jgi:hypothetical protein